MEPKPPDMPEQETSNEAPSPIRGRERLLTPEQLLLLRIDLLWTYPATIGLSSLTLRAVEVLTHSLMVGRYGYAAINGIAVLALSGATGFIGRKALVATGWYIIDMAKRIRNR